MSLTKKNQPSRRGSAARDRARQAAGQIGPLAQSARTTASEQIGPLAQSARSNAAQQMQTAREWSAPRIEQAAQSVQRNVAPKVAAALEAAAQRIEPAPDKLRDLSRQAERKGANAGQDPGKRRAMIIAGAVGLLAAALGAISAVAARRSASGKTPNPGGDGAAEPAMPLGDAESGVNGQVPTPTRST